MAVTLSGALEDVTDATGLNLGLRAACNELALDSPWTLRRLTDEAARRAAEGRRFCANPDHGTGSLKLQTFGSPEGRWGHTVLSAFIDPAGCDLGGPLTTQTIRDAFDAWDQASPFLNIRFDLPTDQADIHVSFVTNDEDGELTGRDGVTQYPEDGTVHLRQDRTWTEPLLLGVAIHEIGHALGLSHSNQPNGTMYPYIFEGTPVASVDTESAEVLQALYGWFAQRPLADRGTSDRPAMAVAVDGGVESLHMVWKGVEDDAGIYHSVLNDQTWSAQENLSGYGCSYSPALTQIATASGNIGLFMAWKGVEDDSGIYWTRNLGGGWEDQRHVVGVGTSRAPALANVNDEIYMAWKGVDDDDCLYWSLYDGSEGWAPQERIDGVGSSEGPTLVDFFGTLFMFWKGVPDDSTAYYSSYVPNVDPIWKPQRRIEYFAYETGGGLSLAIGTSAPLTATVRASEIFLAWKGVEDDSQIWFSLFADDEFGGQLTVPDVGTETGPAAQTMAGTTFLAWKGVEDDNILYWSRL
jgi:hypothetical protein